MNEENRRYKHELLFGFKGKKKISLAKMESIVEEDVQPLAEADDEPTCQPAQACLGMFAGQRALRPSIYKINLMLVDKMETIEEECGAWLEPK